VGGLDGHRALADGGRHPLDGPPPHVTDRQDARNARLEGERTPLERPAVARLEVRPREHEAVGGPTYRRWQQRGVRLSADHHEQRVGDDRLLVGVAVAEHEVLERPLAPAAHDRSLETHLDVGSDLDVLHQVLGHPGPKRRRPHDQGHLLAVLGQVQRGLAVTDEIRAMPSPAEVAEVVAARFGG
jgi:hypothetical protein